MYRPVATAAAGIYMEKIIRNHYTRKNMFKLFTEILQNFCTVYCVVLPIFLIGWLLCEILDFPISEFGTCEKTDKKEHEYSTILAEIIEYGKVSKSGKLLSDAYVDVLRKNAAKGKRLGEAARKLIQEDFKNILLSQ